MKRFFVLFTLILGLFTISSSSIVVAQATQKSSASVTMKSCLAECRKCQKSCETTLAYCKKKGGKHAEAKHINTLKDCIAACKLSVDFLSRNSDKHAKSCGICAEMCKACAESCEAFGDDKQMKDCAAECRKCADSCDKMSNMNMAK